MSTVRKMCVLQNSCFLPLRFSHSGGVRRQKCKFQIFNELLHTITKNMKKPFVTPMGNFNPLEAPLNVNIEG